MNSVKILAGAALLIGVTACHPIPVPGDKSRDRGFDNHPVSNLKAGIWVDPNGCDHWIIDDGLEGYLSQRLDPYGKPVCSGAYEPNTANGDFKRGIWDPSNS
ncbi:hypothetical protein ACX9MO_03675 [Pseudooceanicola sp. 502str34]|uniref:hypothetical protein n=1 Tax=Maritimibacter alkaliphilus TaxID=404236 RepID=UPI001C981F98|nr:hypothetical protein [Maritimibacter alkaliphilus]MBY6091407.1 hypothetical protein [Maritimibacter alkaliphilus]